jgi:hypothetical protein
LVLRVYNQQEGKGQGNRSGQPPAIQSYFIPWSHAYGTISMWVLPQRLFPCRTIPARTPL